MLQVSALPTPDEAEAAALDQELLMLDGALDDLRQRLQAHGYDVTNLRQLPLEPSFAQNAVGMRRAAEGGPAQAIADAVRASEHISPTADKACPNKTGNVDDVLACAEPAMLSCTGGTLAGIDEDMQARGYR